MVRVSAKFLSFFLLAVAPLIVAGTNSDSGELCEAVAACIEKLDNDQTCDVLPVPERSTVPLLPSGVEYQLTKLRNSVWAFNDGGYLSMIILSGSRLTMVDFPETAKTLLKDATQELLEKYNVTPKRIDMVYSHGHYDHIGAATDFYEHAKENFPKATIKIWGTKETKELIKHSKSKRAPEPDIVVDNKGAVLKIKKGLELQMKIVGGHMLKDLLIFIPRYKKQDSVLMHVDVVYPRWAPWPLLGLSEDLTGYMEVYNKLLKYDFDHFISGHLRIGNKADVKEGKRFTEDLFDAGFIGVAESTPEEFAQNGYGNMFDPTSPVYGNVWYAFVNVVRATQVGKCYRIMIEKWGCRIGGLDVTLKSHCFLAVSYALLEA